ncbi:cytochrome c biogenesis protein ResB [Desulfosporosinus sp.]|uniref:cytochrome c biogenesis protein ResB n=1 Tax=Desulfosporosinus sp. TaxID=157907 RepID=UPI0023161CEF|nr:cytochrome c biogenesis protein ResB [Desulfosporosinus sp.]MCO5387716.1 cytochrome c biogenesis protein ResB [Desulfosporosinus sp.]MDA8224083.1 cytochrome c biogenesis protein ResB [Desulfitobacterium hafniense]
MKEQREGIVEYIWRVFSSMKLGLILLGLVALVSGVGTVFPQVNLDPEKAKEVGQIWKTLGFTQIYSTVWFRLLMGLLCINLIVCSIQRFQGIYNRTFALKPPVSVSNVFSKIKAKLAGESEPLKISVQDVLKRNGFKVTINSGDNGWSFIAIKRRLGNWGSLISHISFVVLVIGAILGTTMGFKGYMMSSAGSTVPINSISVSKGRINQDFSVHVYSAEDRFLANGERDNWYTDMGIIENGTEVLRKTISVNHPLTYRGVTFYQSNFANGASLTVDLKDQKLPIVLQDHGGNYFQAPGTELYLIAAAIKSDPQKPIMLYQVYRGKGVQPVQTGQINAGETIDVQGEYKLTLEGNAGFTGLQVKQDPGVIVVWLGCALLLLGLFLSFYWRSMVVLGVFESGQGTDGELTMGTMAGKVTGGVQQEFDRLIHDIQAK